MATRIKKTVKNASSSQLRIIGGQWRGRVLRFPEVDGLRPTGNRIRETLFNWLMPVLPGRCCLDAFSGSGALGFEALSRGAEACVFVEQNPEAARQLRSNLELVKSTSGKVVQGCVLRYLQTTPTCKFDVVFLDPPFAANLWQPVADALSAWLAPNAHVYIETPTDVSFTAPQGWLLHRQKSAGKVTYSLFLVH